MRLRQQQLTAEICREQNCLLAAAAKPFVVAAAATAAAAPTTTTRDPPLSHSVAAFPLSAQQQQQ